MTRKQMAQTFIEKYLALNKAERAVLRIMLIRIHGQAKTDQMIQTIEELEAM